MTDLAQSPRHPRRIVFMGTPHDAVPTLVALHESGFEVVLVVSQPDRRRGRGSGLQPSPVKAAATALGLPVTSELDDVLDVECDLAVVVAFGRIIPTSMLQRVPMVNLHFSLLPRWRGAAPVERAILAGDAETGVCVMQLAPELDTGGVYTRASIPVGDESTAVSLRGELSDLGAALMVRSLEAGLGDVVPQTGATTYAAKLTSSDLHLDFSRPAVELHRIVRVGGAWTTFRGDRFKVWEARVVDSVPGDPGVVVSTVASSATGGLELLVVQPMGKPRMSATAWANGARITSGERFGS